MCLVVERDREKIYMRNEILMGERKRQWERGESRRAACSRKNVPFQRKEEGAL